MLNSRKGIWINLEPDDFEEDFGLRMALFEPDGGPGRSYALKVEVGEEKPIHTYVRNEAVGVMPRTAVQHLMNQLWAMGFRPKGEGSAGQIAAMTEHLKDLKEIATKLVDFVVKKS